MDGLVERGELLLGTGGGVTRDRGVVAGWVHESGVGVVFVL